MDVHPHRLSVRMNDCILNGIYNSTKCATRLELMPYFENMPYCCSNVIFQYQFLEIDTLVYLIISHVVLRPIAITTSGTVPVPGSLSKNYFEIQLVVLPIVFLYTIYWPPAVDL